MLLQDFRFLGRQLCSLLLSLGVLRSSSGPQDVIFKVTNLLLPLLLLLLLLLLWLLILHLHQDPQKYFSHQ